MIRLPAANGVATSVNLDNYGTYIRVDQSTNVTVTIRDPAGNVVPNYTGRVHFTSTDGAAGLPADYTCTLADAGRKPSR